MTSEHKFAEALQREHQAMARIELWLTVAPKVGENMIYVGKNYTLEQLKADVRTALGVLP